MTNQSAINNSPRDIPIIFSAPMVRALLDGRKTMTRRLALTSRTISEESGKGFYRSRSKIVTSPWQKVKLGDRLWVRENHAVVPQTAYRASEGVQQTICPSDPDMAAIYACGWERSAPRWKPSIHMPRWASRLTLVVTEARVERLQGISADDAIAEGLIRLPATGRYVVGKGDQYFGIAHRDPRIVFCSLWSALHGEASWDANPEVVAITFDVWKSNIDQMPQQMTKAELLAGLDDLLAVPR